MKWWIFVQMRHIKKIALWVKTFFPQIHLEICIWDSFPKTSLLKKPIMSKIIDIEIKDLRGPTSDTLQGSDPFHKKPNYLCFNQNQHWWWTFGTFCEFQRRSRPRMACLWSPWPFETDPWQGPGGIYRGPDSFYRLLIDHHQLRWLANGVARMAIGSILNALWDLWAKTENKSL